MFDKFHDECGVFAIYGHPEAANLAYLGLYALQHRGQESAGIASSDGRHIHCHKSMGHVADIFTPEVLGTCPGELAIGHTRYSTAGDTVLLNAQPFSVACNKGHIAVAHNGNITNAAELRRELEREGSIFQASSDTEVILHLVARSRERTLAGALREALLQLEGAFSLVFLAEDRIIIARDPHGFRPLALGQMELSGGSICYVFASETCAFDLINAVYLGDVEPGEMVIVGTEGMTRERYAPVRAHSHCVFEHVYFSRPDSIVFGRPVQESREKLGRLLAREQPVDADVVVPVPDSGVAAALGYAAESGMPFRQALIRNHYVGRTFIEPSQAIRDFGVKLKLNPVRHLARRQARGSGGRFPRARDHQPQDRAHGARRRRARSASAHLLSAHHFAVFLRRRYTQHGRTDRGQQHGGRDPPLRRSRFARLSVARPGLREAVADTQSRLLLRLLHRQLSHRAGQHRRVDGRQRPPRLASNR